MKQETKKTLEKLEDEAINLLKSFKEHPLKSCFYAIFFIWTVKTIYKIIKEV